MLNNTVEPGKVEHVKSRKHVIIEYLSIYQNENHEKKNYRFKNKFISLNQITTSILR